MTSVVGQQARQEKCLHQIFSKFLEMSCELTREDPSVRVNPLWQFFQELLTEKPLDYPQIYAFLAKMTKDQQSTHQRGANNFLNKVNHTIQHSHSLNVPTITRQMDADEQRRYSPPFAEQNTGRFQQSKPNSMQTYEAASQAKAGSNFIEPPVHQGTFERSPSSAALLTRSHSSMFPLNNSGYSPRGFGTSTQANSSNQVMGGLAPGGFNSNGPSASAQPYNYSSENAKGVIIIEKAHNFLRKKFNELQFAKLASQLKNMGCVCDVPGDDIQRPLKKLFRLIGLIYFKNLINDAFAYGKSHNQAEKLTGLLERFGSNRQALGNNVEAFSYSLNQIIQLRKKTSINAQRLTRAFLFLIENERGFLEAVSVIVKLLLQAALERGEPGPVNNLFPDPTQRMRLIKLLESEFEPAGEDIFLLISAVFATPVNLHSALEGKCDTRRFNLNNLPSFNQMHVLLIQGKNHHPVEYYLLVEEQDAEDFELFRSMSRQEIGLDTSGEKEQVYNRPVVLSASEDTDASRRKSSIEPGYGVNNFSYLSSNQHPMSFVSNFELERSPGYSNSKHEQMKVFEPIINSSRRYDEDEWNRGLLLNRTRDLLHNLNAGSERLNSVARFGALSTPSSKENHQPRSPLKFMSIFKNDLHPADTGARTLFANKGYEFVPFQQGGLL